jgi:NADH:ubiquinone oxidoreductase subunit 2 (subunit N)
MVGAVIGAYLYLRIVVSMWMEEPVTQEPLEIPTVVSVVIGLSVVFALAVGFFPGVLLDAIELVRFAPN